MRLVSLALLLLASPAAAQSFDCAKASTSAEELVCSDARLGALDERIAETYGKALEVARGLDAGAQEAEDMLKATERGWIGGRDECWKTENVPACVEQSYLRREAELVTQFMLQEPTATTFWACDGNPANEVVTMFFDTELPSLRFERGDSIDTGTLVPAASGSRYMGSFGREIWIKGEEAQYREPDPDGSEMTCVVQN